VEDGIELGIPSPSFLSLAPLLGVGFGVGAGVGAIVGPLEGVELGSEERLGSTDGIELG
jgi:hypothetical protein